MESENAYYIVVFRSVTFSAVSGVTFDIDLPLSTD